jgi:hypothetical protein
MTGSRRQRDAGVEADAVQSSGCLGPRRVGEKVGDHEWLAMGQHEATELDAPDQLRFGEADHGFEPRSAPEHEADHRDWRIERRRSDEREIVERLFWSGVENLLIEERSDPSLLGHPINVHHTHPHLSRDLGGGEREARIVAERRAILPARCGR